MFDDKQLSLNEILWNGVIFWAVAFTATEVPYSFVFSKSIRPWQVWADGVLSLIFMADLFFYLRKESEERSGSYSKVLKTEIHNFGFSF